MPELLPIRIGLGNQPAADINFQVIAVGAEHGFGKSHRFIATGPTESRFKSHRFCIALRLVEAGGGLGLAEDVHNAVVTDAVARTKIDRKSTRLNSSH